MIDWKAIKSATKPLFARLCDVPVDRVRWADEAEGPTWTASPTIYLTLRDESGIGIEENRREDVTDNDSIVTTCGQRMFTLSVRCESFSAPIDDPNSAGALLARLRTRLLRATTVEAMHGVFGISTREPLRRVDYMNDGRRMSTYVLDLHCLTVDNDIDTTIGAGGWINEVLIDGTLTNGTETLTSDLDVVGS